MRLANIVLTFLLSLQTIEANTSFPIEAIEVHGLHHLSQKTVLTNIPFKIGDDFDVSHSNTLIENLYQTQFFDHIQVARVGKRLKLIVKERPIIRQITFEGELGKLQEALSNIFKEKNITPGAFLNSAVLANIKSELSTVLRTQNAHYDIQLKFETTPHEDSNQVTLHVKGKLGPILRLHSIQILGNKHFSQRQLLSHLPVTSNRILGILQNKQGHSTIETEKLAIESLEQFYQDRGYLNIKVNAPQVVISSDWKEAHWTIRLNEGAMYTIGHYRVLGLEKFNFSDIQKLIKFKSSQVYNRADVANTEQAIRNYLANRGYHFAKISTLRRADEKTKHVNLVLNVEPGKVTYVRRINILNNHVTKDRVIRGHMQQQEASVYSQRAINASKNRLRDANNIETINVVPQPLNNEGLENQVDLTCYVEEKKTGLVGFKADASWSGEGKNWWEKMQFAFRLPLENFLGIGKDIDVSVGKQGGDPYGSFQAHYSDPLVNLQGVKWNIDLAISIASINQRKNPTAFGESYLRNSGLDTVDKIRKHTSENFKKIWTKHNPWDEVVRKLGTSLHIPYDAFGNSWMFGVVYQNRTLLADKEHSFQEIKTFLAEYGNEFDQVLVKLGWDLNRLKGGLFPIKGMHLYGRFNNVLSWSAKSAHYYTLNLGGSLYTPLLETQRQNIVLGARWEFRYGNTFKKDVAFPFFENVSTDRIRGYEYIGPGTSETNTTESLWYPGGNTLLRGSIMCFLPEPLSSKSYKTSLFFDIGNVYNTKTWSAVFLDGTIEEPLKKSIGVNLDWIVPLPMMGLVPVNISISYPLDQASLHKQHLGYGVGLSFI